MEGMNRRNITILSGANELHHWTGSPATEGGELNGVDMSPTNGPPVWDYDETGKDRKQYRFNCDTKIPGATKEAQDAFIAKYALGKRFNGPVISGLPAGLDWVVAQANVKHNAEGEAASTLTIRLDEVGPTASGGGG